MPTEVQKRYRSNQRRNDKRRKGTSEESIVSKLKRLELLLYWYRHTVETSPEVLMMLEAIPADIEHYEGRAANRAAGRASDDYGD